MFWKVVFYIALGYICSSVVLADSSDEIKIVSDLLGNLAKQNDALWKAVKENENVQFSPVALTIINSMLYTKMYHAGYFYRSIYHLENQLAKAEALSSLIDKLSQSSESKVKIINAVIYDESKLPKEYLSDLKKYYKVEDIKLDFTGGNDDVVLDKLNEWTGEKTKGRTPKFPKLPVPLSAGVTSFEVSAVTFKDCWRLPKKSAKSIRLNKFNIQKDDIIIETFNAQETIGYYNNVQKKYEAIRVPFVNKGLFTTIILPYEGEPLKTVKSLGEADYIEIFNKLGQQSEHVDYAVPFLNMTSFNIDKNGASLNEEYSVAPEECSDLSPPQENEVDTGKYKKFYVDRPFTLIVYDEKTRLVLLNAIIRDPTMGLNQVHYFNQKELK